MFCMHKKSYFEANLSCFVCILHVDRMQHIQCKFEAGGVFYMHIPNSNPVTSKACINRGGRGGGRCRHIYGLSHLQLDFIYSDIGIYKRKFSKNKYNKKKGNTKPSNTPAYLETCDKAFIKSYHHFFVIFGSK